MASTTPINDTIWVFGDQLNRAFGPLATAEPHRHTILFVESQEHLARRAWHQQRVHLIVTSMRRFAQELITDGFVVDYRRASTYHHGLTEHQTAFSPSSITAMAPSSYAGRAFVASLGVSLVDDDRFLTSPDEFQALFAGKKRFTMETFYRWQRHRLGYLMDGDEPATGRWNYDEDNRQALPKGGVDFPEPIKDQLDGLDREVIADLPDSVVGAVPAGWWPTSRSGALARLDHVITKVLPHFGPYEDAMTTSSWHLAHTMLSPALNLGLLHPREVADAIETAYRSGTVPIASAEGLLRQVIGWREFVWCLYWTQGPEYKNLNALNATRPLPPLFTSGSTAMNCVSQVLGDIDTYGWTHHIPRLMVLGNLGLISGINPIVLMDWMSERFVDAAEWVMAPNVIGMALYGDGGVMATKPYAAGGAYIDKMSDFCKDCVFDRKARTGPQACPFTTLYWHFLDRHHDQLRQNHRMARQVAAAGKLSDVEAVRIRAHEVLDRLDRGAL
jgi:deoxyribodipyrimidine photolyase-related protein